MKIKPKGRRYRNLVMRGQSIQYERLVRGKRSRFSCETNDWRLLTAGVQLGYVSRQLGHGDVATTARNYARWTGGRRLPGTDAAPARRGAGGPARPPRLPTKSPQSHNGRGSVISLTIGRCSRILERETGLEPATLSLGRKLRRGCGR